MNPDHFTDGGTSITNSKPTHLDGFATDPEATTHHLSSAKARDSLISASLSPYLSIWTGPNSTSGKQSVGVILTLVEPHARIMDGTRNSDVDLAEIDSQEFLTHVLESHANQDFQWIFDQFWCDRIIDHTELKKIVGQYCAEIEDRLVKFIQEKAPINSWVPDEETDHWEFLEGLKIPLLHGGPDMLLYDLGSFVCHPDLQARVQNIFSETADEHVVVLNTSGSGKTRLTLEGLCQFWGLYFTSCVDIQGHGSTDLQNSIHTIQHDKNFSRNLPDADFVEAHEANMTIARNRFQEVLYARLVILEMFCGIAKKLNSGNLLDEHKKFWLILQLKPSCLGNQDIFAELSKRIQGIKPNLLTDLNEVIATRIQELINPGEKAPPMFCIIDEAQSAATECIGAFRSLGQEKQHQPRAILRELVAAWVGILGLWLILAGTGMSRSVVEETMASAVLKGDNVRTSIDVGGFDDAPSQIGYMKGLMPDGFKDTEEAERLFELAHYWLRGRFRFTAAFMRELLLSGFQDTELLLQEYISACTSPPDPRDTSFLFRTAGFVPTGGRLDASIGKKPKRIVKGLKSFRFERLKEDATLFQEIKIYISEFYMRSRLSADITENEFEAVEYGFARLAAVQDSTSHVNEKQLPTRVVLDEPLVVLALHQWLGEKDLPVHEGLALRARRGVQEASGVNALEEYFAFYLSTVFDDDTPLDQIFHFDPIPPWATKPAQLVSLYRRSAPWHEDGGRQELESGRVLRASRPSVSLGIGGQQEYSKGWLRHKLEAPFLFPDTYFGPDIFFILQLGDQAKSKIWVALQSKFCCGDLLSKAQLESALRSVTPSRFYLGDPKDPPNTDKEKVTREAQAKTHEEILPLLEKLPGRLRYVPERPEEGAGVYSLLRVVAGWKSRIDLHKRGQKRRPVDQKGTGKKKGAGKKKPTESALNFYEDQEKHPVAELNIAFMRSKIRMLDPQDDPDFSDVGWMNYPFTQPAKRKVVPGYNLGSDGGRVRKRLRLSDPSGGTEEGSSAFSPSTQTDAEMSPLTEIPDADAMSDDAESVQTVQSRGSDDSGWDRPLNVGPSTPVPRRQTRAMTKAHPAMAL
ncbi:hypothetical protein B0H11DRAFT_2015049 [Mycena galericulata]|nr:hypothetical protein B0H11DRAFT_2015049 [Mycena galericulata]